MYFMYLCMNLSDEIIQNTKRTTKTKWNIVSVHFSLLVNSIPCICNKYAHLNSKSQTLRGLMTEHLLVNCHIKQTGPNWKGSSLVLSGHRVGAASRSVSLSAFISRSSPYIKKPTLDSCLLWWVMKYTPATLRQ